MHVATTKEQEALLCERFGSFIEAINRNRVFIQFDDTSHPYTRLNEVSNALSEMSITEVKQC